MIDTTLMMVTYNRLDLTKQTIEHLFLNYPGRDYNLVIIDNGSTDGTVEYLNALKFNLGALKIVLLPENRGIAIGRNLALQEADKLETKWYCTMDNDVILPNDWLKNCVDILEANKAFGAIGVNFESTEFPLVTKGGFTFQEKPHGNLGTALMVFRKQLHQMLGFFNTEYGRYSMEDSDWGMRTRVLGFKLGYIVEMGTHLGVGESDQGLYREFKTKIHNDNLAKFNANCGAYVRREKPLFIPFKEI